MTTFSGTLAGDDGSTLIIKSATLVDAPPPPPPPPVPTVAPTAVRAGSSTYPVAGVNVARGVDQLVVYSPPAGAPGTTTTNQWGAEVVVQGGKVTRANDRQPNGDLAGTAIPFDGYVLSGHGKARDWLLANARQSADVVLVTTPPAPAPVPTPVPTGGRLPAKVAAMWLYSWSGPGLGQWPADVAATVNHVVIAGLASGGTGTGRLTYGGGGLTPAAVAAAVARGCNVVAGIGGSSTNGQIILRTSANAREMADSLIAMAATYGLRGFDLDIENTVDWTEGALSELVDILRARDPGWIVGLTMGLYGDLGAKWVSAARLLGDRLDYAAPMLYDFPEAGDSRQSGVAVEKVRILVAGGVPASKVILGYMPRVSGETYPNSSPTSVIEAAHGAALKAYPDLRGAFVWESAREARNSPPWSVTRGLLRTIRGA